MSVVDLAPDVAWIAECYAHDDHHEHVSVYLIDHDGAYIAVDAGSFYHRKALTRDIDVATDGAGIDAIVLSHSDYPHAGNVRNFLAEWDEVELVASSGSPEIQGLPDARRSVFGEGLDVRGRTLEFIDPPLADRSHTAWIYDPGSKTLFTADGFGAVHQPDACEFVSTDFDDGIALERIFEYHRENLVWLRYVDPDKLRSALVDIFDCYEVGTVAPVHGHPIVGEDIPRYLDALIDAADRIAGEYSVPEGDD